MTYHYDKSNRLTDVLEVRNGSNITTVYTYDGNGNQIKVAATEPGDVINVSEYTFDGFNQLKVAKTQDSTSTSKYDAFGLRVEKTVDGVTTKYYYDGQSILLEVRSDGLESHNIQGVNLIARKIKGDSDTLYYLYNGHADVVKLVDGAANTVNEYDYDIFGNILYQLESKPNPYKYSGYYYDDDTGYYYLRSRYYDPKIARFISEDTYTGEYNDPLSLNLYTYCQNDPITYDDPNGHWLHIAAGALIGGLVNTAITAVSDFMEDGKFNKSWREYAGSFAEGAITGAIGAATGGASFIAAAAASAAGSVVGNAVGQYISKGKVDVKEALFAGATDLVTMGAGKLAGNLTKKGMNKLAKTAFGQNVLKKANSVKSKVLNNLSGVKTKVQAVAKAESSKLKSKLPKFSKATRSPVNKNVGSGGPFGWIADKYRGMRLKQIHKKVVSEVDDAIAMGNRAKLLSLGAGEGEINRVLQGGSQAARFRSSIIDTAVKNRASNTFGLKSLMKAERFEYGPDFWNPKTMRAWDMTTHKQWKKHVKNILPMRLLIGLYGEA